MTPELSIVLTNRDEPMAGYTVRRIHETADVPVEVIVVEDGSRNPLVQEDMLSIVLERPVGLAYARDVGIIAAKSDAVLVLDAHMNFHDDGASRYWASYCANYARQNPSHLGCAVSVQLDSDRQNTAYQQMDMTNRHTSGKPEPRAKYFGARIETVDRKTGRPFPCKWNGVYRELIEDGTAGIIQSVLGGAYVLNRSWYINTLKRPWEPNRGWGTSEQTISMPNWLMGGESVLLPIEIGHQYRTGKQCYVPYSVDEEMEVGILWNRYRIIQFLPMGESLRGQLLDKCLQNQPAERIGNVIKYAQQFPPQLYREYLASEGTRTFGEYLAHWEMEVEL